MKERQAWLVQRGDMVKLRDGRVREVVNVHLVLEVEGDPVTEHFGYDPKTMLDTDRPHNDRTCQGYNPSG